MKAIGYVWKVSQAGDRREKLVVTKREDVGDAKRVYVDSYDLDVPIVHKVEFVGECVLEK